MVRRLVPVGTNARVEIDLNLDTGDMSLQVHPNAGNRRNDPVEFTSEEREALIEALQWTTPKVAETIHLLPVMESPDPELPDQIESFEDLFVVTQPEELGLSVDSDPGDEDDSPEYDSGWVDPDLEP